MSAGSSDITPRYRTLVEVALAVLFVAWLVAPFWAAWAAVTVDRYGSADLDWAIGVLLGAPLLGAVGAAAIERTVLAWLFGVGLVITLVAVLWLNQGNAGPPAPAPGPAGPTYCVPRSGAVNDCPGG